MGEAALNWLFKNVDFTPTYIQEGYFYIIDNKKNNIIFRFWDFPLKKVHA